MRRALFASAALVLSGCATTAAPDPVVPVSATAGEERLAEERLKPFQFLYGSAEGGALAVQAYHAMVEFAREKVSRRPSDSVVLAADPAGGEARFLPCGSKPFAAILDVDETAIANLGYEALVAQGKDSREVFQDWQTSGSDAVAPIPGAVYAVNELRRMGVTVIFNANRTLDKTDSTVAMLEAAGLGPVVHGENLFLRGDIDGQRGKDGRRYALGEKFCVIAMAGDQLGDFADLFNERDVGISQRRTMALRGWAAQMWGEGWFLMPNPVYGPAIEGTIDEIFPADKRWTSKAGN